MTVGDEIRTKLNQLLGPSGLECHPFKVGWYNNQVKQGFQLDFHEDTLAFVVISSPSFFEKCFIPYVCKNATASSDQDLLDKSTNEIITTATKAFPDDQISVMYDFEMRPGTRRPKVLVQTAGHVSGAVYFYQKANISNPPWASDQGIYGVCLHPKYSGWFALRAVLVFRNIQVPELVQLNPKDVLQDEAMKIELLNRYNFNWQDWSFRDIVEPIERYSELQKQYFRAKPAERGPIIEMIRNQYSST